MSNNDNNIEKRSFEAFINAIGSEIEQAQAIRFNYPEKKGYSIRNLAYMCQFARSYPLGTLQSFVETDVKLTNPSVRKITDAIQSLNNVPFMQEPLAQIQDVSQTVAAVYQMPIEDMEKLFMSSPVARINWASHVIILNSSLPLGVEYWYMKQSVEMGWSSNVLKMQIENKLYKRQINSQKVNNFTATLPAPQSDLANYLLKDPYIFDLAGAKERADERDIEEQLVNTLPVICWKWATDLPLSQDRNISKLATVISMPT